MMYQNDPETEMLAITSQGLRPLSGEKLYVGAEQAYYLGASSSPEQVIVTEATDKWVTYAKYPYYGTHRMDARIFRDLAQQGCQTKLDFIKKNDLAAMLPVYAQMKDRIETVLNGESGMSVCLEDYQRVEVFIQPLVVMKDAWHTFERKFQRSLSGQRIDTGELSLTTSRADAVALAEELEGSDTFKFAGMKDDRGRPN